MRYSLSAAPGQLRQGAQGRGRGWQQLLKPARPAAGTSLTRVVPPEFWERLQSLSFTLATTGTAGTRSLAINLLDGDGYIFNSTPVNSQIGPSQTLSVYADIFSVTQAQAQQGFNNSGTVTNPGANATIISLTVPGGVYTVNWAVALAGTVTTADANNMTLNAAGVPQLRALFPGVVGNFNQPAAVVSVPPGGNTIAIVAAAAASGASAIYWASLAIAPAPGFPNQVQIPDLVMKSGWQYQLLLGNPAAGDQISGIGMLLDRFPSSDIYELEGDPVTAVADAILARGH